MGEGVEVLSGVGSVADRWGGGGGWGWGGSMSLGMRKTRGGNQKCLKWWLSRWSVPQCEGGVRLLQTPRLKQPPLKKRRLLLLLLLRRWGWRVRRKGGGEGGARKQATIDGHQPLGACSARLH